jgi:hypothetical protein
MQIELESVLRCVGFHESSMINGRAALQAMRDRSEEKIALDEFQFEKSQSSSGCLRCFIIHAKRFSIAIKSFGFDSSTAFRARA